MNHIYVASVQIFATALGKSSHVSFLWLFSLSVARKEERDKNEAIQAVSIWEIKYQKMDQQRDQLSK